MLKAFREWFQRNAVLLEQSDINVEVSKASEGSSNDGIHANLETGKCGATVQLWQDGQSDFSFVEWEAADSPSDVLVTHYDFQNEGELFKELADLVKRMSKDGISLFITGDRPISGNSESTYIAPSSSAPSRVSVAKGKSE